MSALELFAGVLGGAIIGYVAHELAHYVVAALAGRRPVISLRSMSVELDIHPITWDVRLAAVAPALLGVVVLLIGVLVGVWRYPLLWGLTFGACVRLFALSPEDRDIALGGSSPL